MGSSSKNCDYRKSQLKRILFSILVINLLSCNTSNEPVYDLSPQITQQPDNVTINEGEDATFAVRARGSKPLIYQWYKNGLLIESATDSVYSVFQSSFADNGSVFSVGITNNFGTITSESALLTIKQGDEKVITFTTEGSGFAPIIEVEGEAEIIWTWADGTTSNSTNPSKNYGSPASRQNTLLVTPWSSVKSIIIGYDAEDGGSENIPKVPDQKVSQVKGLELVAPYLEIWCSSYNQLTELNFDHFINLHTIECYFSHELENVSLTNTPSLKRACFEDCKLNSLDLSQSPAIEDLRGATNNFGTLVFGSKGANVWHICIRDNPQLNDREIFSVEDRFPMITDLYIWNSNQSGLLRISSTHQTKSISILAEKNSYTRLDLSGSLLNDEMAAEVLLGNNALTEVTIAGCIQINHLSLENNDLSQNQVDDILMVLDDLGRKRENFPYYILKVDLRGNAIPGSSGHAHAVNLAAKGWTILTDEWTLQP